MTNRSTFFGTGLLLLFLLQGCATMNPQAPDPGKFQFNDKAFFAAKTLWNQKRPPAYAFDYVSPGWASTKFRVTVKGDKVESIVQEPRSVTAFSITLDEIFNTIEMSVAGARKATGGGSRLVALAISYDPVWGFPYSVHHSYYDPPGTMVDGNSGYRIENFEVLDPLAPPGKPGITIRVSIEDFLYIYKDAIGDVISIKSSTDPEDLELLEPALVKVEKLRLEGVDLTPIMKPKDLAIFKKQTDDLANFLKASQ